MLKLGKPGKLQKVRLRKIKLPTIFNVNIGLSCGTLCTSYRSYQSGHAIPHGEPARG